MFSEVLVLCFDFAEYFEFGGKIVPRDLPDVATYKIFRAIKSFPKEDIFWTDFWVGSL